MVELAGPSQSNHKLFCVNLFLLTFCEPHPNFLLPVCSFILVSDQTHHCRVVNKINDEINVKTHSAVVDEEQQGTQGAALRRPCAH